MQAQMKLFDSDFLSSLMREFRASMRDLLFDLCDDLEAHYRGPAAALRLPVGFFRCVGESLKPEDYSGWKAVGWIELLNDLVYFIDLLEQLRRERHPHEFAAELFDQCEEQFYEHSYLDELFPRGEPEPLRLARRLSGLCRRLASQATQESLFLVPALPCVWLARTRGRLWTVPCDLSPNLERAELGGCVYVGLNGAYLGPPTLLRRRLAGRTDESRFLIRLDGIRLRVNGAVHPLLTNGGHPQWRWRYVPPHTILPGYANGSGGLTLGAALVYRKDLSPWRVVQPPPGLADRLRNALAVIAEAWPAGARNLACLTSRIVPLHARGVVSFSYRHRPGLSFINCFERDALDLIDDLIHENSHHHLNLLLRKYAMRRRDRNQEIFYSPWRRSLRPLHGILHATFTFTMGALLFERLSAWKARGERQGARGGATLTDQQVLRARFRCLEEVASVRYSLQDLGYAARKLGWLTAAGDALVQQLKQELVKVKNRIAPFERAVLRSRYGRELREHRRNLDEKRRLYGRGVRGGQILRSQ
ncbi:MAG: hypothetical protein HY581_05920 [Nitrospirae bacterium]|nr:hypothetical protein [Nitrospirota bacterium]